MVRQLVPIEDDGKVALPDDFRQRHHLKVGDLVAVEDTAEGVVITPRVAPNKATAAEIDALFAPLTPEELKRLGEAIDRILAFRAKMPSIAPLTAADLVHIAREDSTWYDDQG